MKKYYLAAGIALTLLMAMPAITAARGEGDEVETQSSTSIKDKLRSEYQVKVQNIKINNEMRNQEAKFLKERDLRALSSSTRDLKGMNKETEGDIKDLRKDFRDDMRNASSSGERRGMEKELKLDIFKLRMTNLVRQLEVAYNNLKQVRDRLASRITKAEGSGRNMTQPKTLLVTADAKLMTARTAIDALKTYLPSTATSTATSTGSTATSTVNAEKPRKIGDNAIKAVRDAHKALVDVVVSVAHNMGMKTATSTISITPTPTVTSTSTATSTATTTP